MTAKTHRDFIRRELDAATSNAQASRYAEMLRNVQSVLLETVEERYVELPAIGDGAVTTPSNTQKIRPAAPNNSVVFFSGPNDLPNLADFDYVTLTVYLPRIYLAENTQAVLDSAKYTAYASLNGEAPSIEDETGFIMRYGHTYIFSAEQARNLRIVANADRTATLNERGYVVAQFNVGLIPEQKVFTTS